MKRSSRNYEHLSGAMTCNETILNGGVGTSSDTTFDPNNNFNISSIEEVGILREGTIEEVGEIDENGNNVNTVMQQVADFDSITDNGLIRLDMSQIIDQTGLPTYEAAIKLESSGYV